MKSMIMGPVHLLPGATAKRPVAVMVVFSPMDPCRDIDDFDFQGGVTRMADLKALHILQCTDNYFKRNKMR